MESDLERMGMELNKRRKEEHLLLTRHNTRQNARTALTSNPPGYDYNFKSKATIIYGQPSNFGSSSLTVGNFKMLSNPMNAISRASRVKKNENSKINNFVNNGSLHSKDFNYHHIEAPSTKFENKTL